MNAAIKAFAYRCYEIGAIPLGIYDGWEGLMEHNALEVLSLDRPKVRLWDREPGSNLGCTKSNPFRFSREGKRVDTSPEVLRSTEKLALDAVVVIGGRDTLAAAAKLADRGLPVVAIPKSIDMELGGTDYSIGFDSALHACADVVARSRTSAGTTRWVQVVEVVGRSAGHLALWGGLAGGAQMILIPEFPFELQRVCTLLDVRLSRDYVRSERTPRYATIVIAEGARAQGMQEVLVDTAPDEYGGARLGGVGALLAERLRADLGVDARCVAIGHPIRGGAPTPLDRVMAHRLASAAVDLCAAKRFGHMVSARGTLPYGTTDSLSIHSALSAPHTVQVGRDYDVERYFAQRKVR
jgi:6-phosphofructokinase 1